MKVIEAEGKTLEEATDLALAELGNPGRDRVKIEIVEEGSRGLFGLIGNRAARVRVSYSPTRDKALEARDHLRFMLVSMGIQSDAIDIEQLEESEWKLHIRSGEDRPLTQRGPECLEALAFVLSRMVNRSVEDLVRIQVDVNDYLAEVQQELEDYAREQARLALDEKRRIALRPMNSRERKTVHLALREFEGMKTISSGEGRRRRVVIVPDGCERRPRTESSAAERSDSSVDREPGTQEQEDRQ